mgnify:CR=1 FL=1
MTKHVGGWGQARGGGVDLLSNEGFSPRVSSKHTLPAWGWKFSCMCVICCALPATVAVAMNSTHVHPFHDLQLIPYVT